MLKLALNNFSNSICSFRNFFIPLTQLYAPTTTGLDRSDQACSKPRTVKATSHIDVNRRKQTQTVCGGVFAMINKLFAANCKLFAIFRKPFANQNLKAREIRRRQNNAIMAAVNRRRLLRIRLLLLLILLRRY